MITETIIIRLDLYAEFNALMMAARILTADPTNRAARDWAAKSLNALANPTLYTSPEPDAAV